MQSRESSGELNITLTAPYVEAGDTKSDFSIYLQKRF